jgi:predicted nucleic acid-binding protein
MCTSVIVAAELRYGCAEYGDIRSKLGAAGKPIGGNDLLIAVHAHATGATVVTMHARRLTDTERGQWSGRRTIPGIWQMSVIGANQEEPWSV